MSAWRRKALEMMPELRGDFEPVPNVMSLCILLHEKLVETYSRKPHEDDRIRRIYQYARWCLEESRSGDVATAIVVAFFEHLPKCREVRGDLHRWISRQLFDSLEQPFRYHLSEGEWIRFRDEFIERRSAV
jgi:hypothetical protein